jgi:hypothetical protein
MKLKIHELKEPDFDGDTFILVVNPGRDEQTLAVKMQFPRKGTIENEWKSVRDALGSMAEAIHKKLEVKNGSHKLSGL